jgi:MobA/MobL family
VAIRFINARFLRLLPDSGARKVIAYFGRADVFDDRIGARFEFSDVASDLVHEQILLPDQAPPELALPTRFASALDLAEMRRVQKTSDRKRWPQIGAAFVVALPPDREVTLDEAIELVCRIAERIRGIIRLPIYIAIHDPHLVSPGDVNRHGHLFLPLREVDPRGFLLTKVRELFARPRQASEQNAHSLYVAEATNWPSVSFEEQQTFFTELAIDLVVDPSAPYGNRHWTAATMREEPERVESDRTLNRRRNLDVVQGAPAELVGHLLRGRSTMPIAEVRRLVVNLIDNEAAREERMDMILSDASIVTFASQESEKRPSRITTRAARDLIDEAVEFVDSALIRGNKSAGADSTGRLTAVSGANAVAVVSRIAKLAGQKMQPSQRLLLLGLADSHTHAVATTLKQSKPITATIASILEPPALSPFRLVQRIEIDDDDMIIIPKSEHVDDQSLARLMLIVRKTQATLIFGYDEDQRRGIVTSRLAAYAANALDPSRGKRLRYRHIERHLRCGRVDRAITALNARRSFLFEPVAQEISDPKSNFIVCDDPHRIAMINGGEWSPQATSPTDKLRLQSQQWFPDQWVKVTRTDYSTSPPRLRDKQLVQIIHPVPDRNAVLARLPTGEILEINLDKQPFFATARAISIREGRYAPEKCTLLVELTKPRYAWACVLLVATRRSGVRLRIDPSVAIDVSSLIEAVQRSLPAALPSELTARTDPNAEVTQIIKGIASQRVRASIELQDNQLEIDTIPMPDDPGPVADVTELWPVAREVQSSLDEDSRMQDPPIGAIEPALNGPDDVGLEDIPTPDPPTPRDTRIPLHQLDAELRRILSSNDGEVAWKRLEEALHPDVPERDLVFHNLLKLCRADGPTAALLRIAMDGRQIRELPYRMVGDDLDLLEPEGQLPQAWSDWDLRLFETDIRAMCSRSSVWETTFFPEDTGPSDTPP